MIDDRWLLSDGQIIGRARRTTVEGGVRMSLEMPEGEPFIAELAKVNAASIAQFCDLSRGEWHARKASKEAAQVSSSRDGEARKREAGRGTVGGEEDVQGVKESVSIDLCDREALSSALQNAHNARLKLSEQMNELEKKCQLYRAVLEVLDGQGYAEQELSSVSRTEAKGDSEGVDSETPQDVVFTGEEATSTLSAPDEGLEAFPDGEPKTS